ncbi:Anaerobic nitric oxide reductase transcription regulator NorR [subsurface metagenome]|jgi:two-component system response regulator GlrR
MVERVSADICLFSIDECSFLDELIAAFNAIGKNLRVLPSLDDKTALDTLLIAVSDPLSNRDALRLALAGRPTAFVVVPRDRIRMYAVLRLTATMIAWPMPIATLAEITGVISERPGTALPLDAPTLLLRAGVVGRSKALRAATRDLAAMVSCDANVLVTGETGTGKELIARALHYYGPRASEPFIPVNCAAMPEDLFENEMFGHSRGAYTHAATAHTGLIAIANRGTLFFDEIDALSLRSQAALLRVLQDRTFRPLGSTKLVEADFRLVAATNADLAALVAAGHFREDLYFRINVLNLHLPSLRQRPEDVPLLVEHFWKRLSVQYNRPEPPLSPDTIEALAHRTWAGNIRELENWLHRRFLLASTMPPEEEKPTEQQQLDPMWPHTAPSLRSAKRDAVNSVERRYLYDIMRKTAGNVSAAARRAGAERSAFGRLLRKHGINADEFRAGMPGPAGLDADSG